MNAHAILNQMHNVKQFLQKAQDYRQYDDLDWEVEGGEESPSRLWYRKVLFGYGPTFSGKSVLDVGSGVGQLFPFLEKGGATRIIGLEPSHRNFVLSKKFHPEGIVYKSTLQKTRLRSTFDIAVIILSFEHIGNLDAAFTALRRLLNKNGIICLMTVDKAYAETPRFGYGLKVVHINQQSSVTRTTRHGKTMWDIVRLPEAYIAAGKANGFTLQKHLHMRPQKTFISAMPKYKRFARTTMHHFYVFKKI